MYELKIHADSFLSLVGYGAFLFHGNHGEKLFSPEIHDDDSIDFVRFEKIDMNTRFINFIIERRGEKREK